MTPATSHPPPTGKMGFWMCTALVLGNMIGSGIFLLPATLGVFGGISLFGWVLTTGGAVSLAFMFARLSVIVSVAGGPYAYTRAGLGDLAGFMVAWGYWISICCGNAAISVALVGYLAVFWPDLSSPIMAAAAALAAIWFLTFINARGVRGAGYLQLFTTLLKLIPLVVIGTVGFTLFHPEHFTPFNRSGQPAFSAITASAALTLWAFLGLESASIPTHAIENPHRNIPRATVIGVLVAAVVYISSTLAVMGIIAPGDLASSTAPFADAARELGGPVAAYGIALGAACACFGALNGWILLQGQLPLAVARDGLFPAIFARVSVNQTPVAGLMISSGLVTLLVMVNFTRGLVELFTFFILLATLNTLMPYIMLALAALVMHFRPEDSTASKKPPAVFLVAVPALIYSVWAVLGLQWEVIGWGIALLLAGVPIYILIRKQHRTARQSQ